MMIPKGTWCVVRRHVRDTTSRGEIIKGGLTEKSARYIQNQYRNVRDWNYWAMENRNVRDWNYWAMERKDY